MPDDENGSEGESGSQDETETQGTEEQEQLGEAGKKALEAERSRAKTEAARAKKLERELEDLRKSQMSESEKAVAEARAEGRKEALTEANSRLLRAEVRAVAAGKLADPGDAIHLLDLSQFEVDADGDVNRKAIESAIDALVKSKPYLSPAGSKPGPLPGGGARPAGGFSMNDEIRRKAGHL